METGDLAPNSRLLRHTIADFCTYSLTSRQRGLAWIYHLRSNSGSNGPIAKECHRFLVAGPFNFRDASLREPILMVIPREQVLAAARDSRENPTLSSRPSAFFIAAEGSRFLRQWSASPRGLRPVPSLTSESRHHPCFP